MIVVVAKDWHQKEELKKEIWNNPRITLRGNQGIHLNPVSSP